MVTRESLRWAQMNEGDQLTRITFPLSLRNLMIDVAGTRDLYPIHHDRDFARANGARDIFVNTMWYQAFFGRLVTDWAGPEAFLRKLTFQMRAPNCPGDTVTSRATVVRKYEQDGMRLVDIDARLDNQLESDTTIAAMTVELP